MVLHHRGWGVPKLDTLQEYLDDAFKEGMRKSEEEWRL